MWMFYWDIVQIEFMYVQYKEMSSVIKLEWSQLVQTKQATFNVIVIHIRIQFIDLHITSLHIFCLYKHEPLNASASK